MLRTSRTELPVCRRKGTVEGYTMLAADMKRRFIAGLWSGTEFPEIPNPGFGPPPVVAYVNEGRWVANCPSCNGAELVDPEEDFFFCLSCFNREISNRARRVVFPSPVTLREIAAELSKRPIMVTRNWLSGESSAALRAENAEHGIG